MDYLEQLEKGRYGSFELKRQVGPNLLKGLFISLLIHGTVIASPFIIARLFLNGEAIPPAPPGVVYLTKPPLLVPDDPNPATKVDITVSKPVNTKYMRPVPVPPSDLDDEQPIMPDQDALKHALGGKPLAEPGDGTGNVTMVYREPPPDDPIPDPKIFRYVEIDPQELAGNPQPEYPEIAKLGGMEGLVRVQVYVDKHGDVKKWQILQAKPAGYGFEDEVAKVIPKWRFTPGVQSGIAVGAWVAVPVHFKVKK